MQSKACHFCGHEVSEQYCPICRARIAPVAPEIVYDARNLGKAFDDSALPQDTQTGSKVSEAVRAIGWSNTKTYCAVAHLERSVGGKWCVVGIEKSGNINTSMAVTAF